MAHSRDRRRPDIANPLHHALSSVKKWGGEYTDYIAIHSWFDQTKAHLADPRHRMILHNTLGIFMCEQQFGPAIKLSTGKLIPTRWVGEQHVEEDFGRSKIPTVGHCWQSVPPYQGEVIASYDHALWSAQSFGGSVMDYLPVHQWLDQAWAFFPDQRSDLMLHNTFGIALAEQRFGTHVFPKDISMNGRPLKVPVRDVVTLHIRTDLGKDIPTLETCLLSMKKEMWMGRGARAISDEVEELTHVS